MQHRLLPVEGDVVAPVEAFELRGLQEERLGEAAPDLSRPGPAGSAAGSTASGTALNHFSTERQDTVRKECEGLRPVRPAAVHRAGERLF